MWTSVLVVVASSCAAVDGSVVPVALEPVPAPEVRGLLALGDRAEVESAIVDALRRHPALRLVPTSTAVQIRLEVPRLDVAADAFSEPAVRATTYRVAAQLEAMVIGPSGSRRVEAVAIARAVAPSGGLGALDGSLRVARAQATERAAERLVLRIAAAVAAIRAEGPVDRSPNVPK